VGARLRGGAERQQGQGQVVVHVDELGRGGGDATVLGERQLDLAGVGEEVGEVEARLGLVGIQRQGALEGGARAGPVAAPFEDDAEVGPGGGEGGVEIEGAPELGLGASVVTGVEGGEAGGEAGVGAVRLGVGAQVTELPELLAKLAHGEGHDELAAGRLPGGLVVDDHQLLAVGADAELRQGPLEIGEPPPQRLEVGAHPRQAHAAVEEGARDLERHQIAEGVVEAALLAHARAQEAGLRPVTQA
jgi:hypothetical protein